jgi:hypothetical protein
MAPGIAGHAAAQTLQTCNATTALKQNDPTSGITTDLQVTGSCEVKGATSPNAPLSYYFHSVNILSGGSLNFDDALTNFYAENIVVEAGGALIAGSTTAPIGTAGGILTIHLWGAPSDPGVLCKSASGNCGIASPPWGTNIASSMNPSSCTPTPSLPGGVNDCFYNYGTLDAADGTNPAYFGHKVLAVSYNGTLQLFGKKGATYTGSPTGCADPTNTASCTGTSWVRLTKDALPGDTSLQIAGPVDWQDKDNIVLTTTDYLPGHSEQLQVKGTPGASNTIDLVNPVQYPHNGELFDLSNASFSGISRLGTNFPASADMRAAVGLLTRSIRIVSDGDTPGLPFAVNAGNPDNYYGGHTIVRQGFLSYQVQGVEFYQLGQGGSIMHYPVHFHMVRQTAAPAGPGLPPPTYVQDSSVWDSMTRWIVLHGTQGVLLARNVGYESIGHGYYLEDGTETGNQLYANLGVLARGAVANGVGIANPQNPRMAPGILTATAPVDASCKTNPLLCPSGYSAFPYYSDSQNPTVFWIMNGMNDFQYNMAAGANTCGACYWLVPGAISGPSQFEKWFGYASEQAGLGRAGTTPLQNFVGNSCTTAMEGFVEVGPINACNGVNQIDPAKLKSQNSTLLMLPSPQAPATNDTTYWPQVSGLRVPTRCKSADAGTATADCSSVAVCASSNEANCDVVVLNKFTTAFNSPQTNFAAVWLRSLWSLAVDDVVSDPQNAGINLVTSGGYDSASVFPGYWGLVRQSALIGSSQWQNTTTYKDGLALNPYTSNAGPFNPFSATIGSGPNSAIKGLTCAVDPFNGNANNAYCLSQSDAVSFQVSNFGGFQRLFSVYDGPIFQDSNAYLNIRAGFLTSDGTATGNVLNTKGGDCKPSDTAGNPCQYAGFISGGVTGLRAYKVANDAKADRCYEPNAAIGWKQPNGFYYAPAFHSINLFFSGVDIRHFVTEPLFTDGLFSFKTNETAAKKEYCAWNPTMFQGFTDIDRETVLNDDDGTLTGLTSPIGPSPIATPTPSNAGKFETISVNKESFFDAPTEAWECASDYPSSKSPDAARCLPASAKTSPYEYVSTVIYPECAKGAPPPPESGSPSFCPNDNDNWGSVCTSSPPNFGCLGVPLYRQLLKAGESKNPETQRKRMMGQNNFQRSALTGNHGWYYLDTTVSKDAQTAHQFQSPTAFSGGGAYDLFFLYTKPSTVQTYQMFIGTGFDTSIATTNVKYGYEGLTLPFQFTQASTSDGKSGAWSSSYDPGKGILTLKTNMTKLPGIYSLSAFLPGSKTDTLGAKYCQPATMCSWSGSRCVCNASGPYASVCSQTNPAKQTVCDWSVRDLDCPAPGCPAFQITFPPACTTGGNKDKCFAADDKDHRPAPGTFDGADFTYFNVPFNLENATTAGNQCLYTKQPDTVNKCPAVK